MPTVGSTPSTDRCGGKIQRDREEERRLVGEFARTVPFLCTRLLLKLSLSQLVFPAFACQLAPACVVKCIDRIVVAGMRGGNEILIVAGRRGEGRRLAIFVHEPREFLPDGFPWKWAATVGISDTEACLRVIPSVRERTRKNRGGDRNLPAMRGMLCRTLTTV